MSLKRRIEILEKASQGEYATIERVLERIDLEAKTNLTPAEGDRLKYLLSLKPDPKLVKAFAEIDAAQGNHDARKL